ncbi:MAG: indole-3-glycerol phosphate synthase TrpC, partial [Pseudomonadota bacterium]|nr:indole-3-glycerol phosphate synthase TrpC [Pseudomonadota bacterium]
MLEDILKNKEKEVQKLKKEIDWSGAIHSCTETTKKRGFMQSLKNKVLDGKTAIIAEIKRHSPSKGYLDKNLNLKSVAEQYERAGAACISVLTDQEYFKGSLNDLVDVKKFTTLPVLRKDFIIDEYQVYESRALGADCILLIASALKVEQLKKYESIAHDLDMAVLVEVHNEEELEKAILLDTPLVGINNRNLKTFEVSLNTS